MGFQVKEAVENLDASAPTIIGFFKEFRKMMGDFLEKNRRLICGPNMHVEMDETHMFKRKYNVGRVPRSVSWWVVGGICRETGEIFAVLVRSRKKASLNEIIVQNIAPGTTILTDKWGGYVDIEALGQNYVHFSVNHSRNFVNPQDRTVHTQNIERLWRTMKEEIPEETRKYEIESYINRFLFFQRYQLPSRSERFHVVLELIRNTYRIE